MLVKLLSSTAKPPRQGSKYAAGYDLCSDQKITLHPGDRTLVSTGLAIAIPKGHYGRIAPRSGLAVKKGIDIGAGVIDNDYRGEVKILMLHNGKENLDIEVGDRIAQLILESYSSSEVMIVEDLEETERGTGGFGSTGVQ